MQLPLVLLIQFGALQIFGIYTFVWRYIGMAEVLPFIKAACWSFLPLLFLRLGFAGRVLHSGEFRFRSCLMTTVFGIGGVLALRVLRRWVYERYEKTSRGDRVRNGHKKPVLLVGAGQAGVLAAREITNRGDLESRDSRIRR